MAKLIEKGRISPLQLSILVFIFTIGTTVLAIPSVMTARANQDAWLSSLIGILLCVFLAAFFALCAKPIGRETYIQYLERVYGKVIGKIIGVTYVFFGFIGTSTLLFQFGNFVTTQMLVETPIEIINLMLVLLIIASLRAGLEVLARTSELLFPWFMFLFIALVILLLPQIELDRISPLYEAKINDHLSAALDFVSFAGFPLVVFLMFYPGNINRPDKVKWNLILGTFFGALVVGVFVFLCILVLGSAATARQIYPSYVLAKTVSVFDIIERIEAAMASMWILSIFFKTAIYFYACVVGLAEILEVKNYRFLALPIGILTFLFSMVVYPNVAFMSHWDNTYWVVYSMIMGFFIPLFTLILHKIKSLAKPESISNDT
ncbi:endospore germination permease [Cytobacillus sp. FJAT-53684]|uniref:Endospore germination permease n=1 Tax=Cytobacillus mangrovibacter TaxID=3299024 RepID=A0ABW6JZ80_9BACI